VHWAAGVHATLVTPPVPAVAQQTEVAMCVICTQSAVSSQGIGTLFKVPHAMTIAHVSVPVDFV